MSEWVATQLRGRRLPAGPGDELRALEAERDRAEARGDLELVADVDHRLDELVAAARARVRDAEREERRRAVELSAPGVRKPVPRRQTPAEQMAAMIARALREP